MGVGAGRGGWGAGLRFVPPKAEAERQGLLLMRRSKKRASEQREDFFGHRKAARTAICRGVRRRKSRCRDRNLNKQLFA